MLIFTQFPKQTNHLLVFEMTTAIFNRTDAITVFVLSKKAIRITGKMYALFTNPKDKASLSFKPHKC